MARAGLGPSWRCLFANDIDKKKAVLKGRLPVSREKVPVLWINRDVFAGRKKANRGDRERGED